MTETNQQPDGQPTENQHPEIRQHNRQDKKALIAFIGGVTGTVLSVVAGVAAPFVLQDAEALRNAKAASALGFFVSTGTALAAKRAHDQNVRDTDDGDLLAQKFFENWDSRYGGYY